MLPLDETTGLGGRQPHSTRHTTFAHLQRRPGGRRGIRVSPGEEERLQEGRRALVGHGEGQRRRTAVIDAVRIRTLRNPRAPHYKSCGMGWGGSLGGSNQWMVRFIGNLAEKVFHNTRILAWDRLLPRHQSV